MPGNNQVTVTVTKTTSGASATFQIQLDKDPFDLQGLPDNAPILWTIRQPSAWYFGSINGGGGIAITNGAGKFDPPANESGGQPRVVNSRRIGAGDGNTYKYSISVTDGDTTLLFDPSIINR